MDYLVDSKPTCLLIQDCQCNACTYLPKLHIIDEQSDINRANHLHNFMKMLPIGFPIVIQQTLTLQRQSGNIEYISFFNPTKDDKCKWILSKQTVRSVNALSSQNVQLYFSDRERLVPKFQAQNMFSPFGSARSDKSEVEQIIYVQPYQPRPTVRSYFNHERPLKDNLLVEYLKKQEDHFRGQNYKVNQQMLEWVFRQYGQQCFCNFITEYYIRLFKTLTRHQIKSGVFFWALQPYKNSYNSSDKTMKAQYDKLRMQGRPRSLPFKPKLLNVKSLQVEFFEKLYSFQDQYSDKIKERINSSHKTTIAAIKNKTYRLRLQNFRKKLKNVFDSEQQTVLEKIEEEKQFEFQHDSQTMAQMLIPNMAPYKSLREVISNQQAFRKVFAKELKGEHQRFKTEYNIKSEPIKKKQLSHIRSKERSKTTLKQQLSSPLMTVERRHKLFLKTPSTHE